MTTSNN